MARTCRVCGAKQVPGAAFCHACGTEQNALARKRRRRRSKEPLETSRRFDERRPPREHAGPAGAENISGPTGRNERAELQRRWNGRTPRPTRDGQASGQPSRRGKSNRPVDGVRAPSDDQERVLWSDTFSAKGLIHYWLAASTGTILLPIAAVTVGVDASIWKLLLSAIAAAWIALIGWLIYLKLDAHYVLTTQRFLHKRGILLRHTRRIEVIDIDDISFQQGILERLINVGSIELISSDRSDPVLVFDGIDNVHEVAHAIDEARRAERLRRGLHIEAV